MLSITLKLTKLANNFLIRSMEDRGAVPRRSTKIPNKIDNSKDYIQGENNEILFRILPYFRRLV